MQKKKKISLDLDIETMGRLEELTQKPPFPPLSVVIRFLIKRGLEADVSERQQQQLWELTSLKMLHILREIARTRSDEFLQSVDEKFTEELPLLRHMIMEEGMDYADR